MNNTASNPKCIPELRFPGFEGEWIQKSMGEICNGIMYGMNSAAISFDGENKYLRITDIDEETREFRPNPLSSPEGDIEDKYILKKGDIVFARTGASVGKSYLYRESDGKLLFAGFLIKFTVKNSNSYFIYSHTLTSSFKKWVQLMSMRSGQPGINAEEYKLLKLFLPSIPEQTKIASFLTAVDDKIRQLTRKKELLEQYKKGVMQKIFNREIRFRRSLSGVEGEKGIEYPEWENVKLGDLIKSIMAGNTKPQIDGQFNVYGSMGIIGKSDSYTHDGKFLLIARVGANAGSINQIIGKFCATDNTLVLEPQDYVDINYLYFSLIHFDLSRLIFGSGQPLITGGQLKKIDLLIPTLNEQQSIASFLSSIDKKITLVSQQIENMQIWKKGLLQKMFV